MRRRTFLKVGLIGGAVLTAAGGALWLLKPEARDAAVNPDTATVLRGVIPALLSGALPLEPKARAVAIEGGLKRTLATIAGLPHSTRLEIGELIGLLSSAPGRWLAGIEQWPDASEVQVAAFLQRWRAHSFDLFQVGYHALHELVLGPWYADESTWAAIGYPGPIKL